MRGFDLFFWMATVVTHFVTVVLVEILSKIVENCAATTGSGFRIPCGLFQQLTPNFLLAYILFVQELLKTLNILDVKVGDTRSFASVASCSTCFLVVTFQGLWHVVMQYKANIWFIDTHTKGNGCHNDIAILIEEGILVLHTFAGFQSRMIGQGIDAVHLQLLCKILYFLTRQTIDDDALALVRLEQFGNISVDVAFGAYLVVEVRAVKA